MEEITLNRLEITGILDETTPFCVVKEILQAHNLSIGKLNDKDVKFMCLQNEIVKLNSYRPATLFGGIEENIRYIATFVNPLCKTWTKRSLLKAYEHLINFPRDNPNVLQNIHYCQKDGDNTDAFNACMLYTLCKRYHIETSWKMTGEQMANLLHKLSIDSNKLRSGLIPLLESLNKSQLINLYSSLEKDTKKSIQLIPVLSDTHTKKIDESKPMVFLDQEKLKSCYQKFTDKSYLLLTVQPRTHFEAIVLAGMIYNLNITESKFPLQEYDELSEVKNPDIYVPIDINFRKRFLLNRSWYQISHHWCPALNFLYSDKELKDFCYQEGYTNEDFRSYDVTSLLHMSRISNNIYIGKNVYNEQEHTPINLDTISELSNFDCITIGVVSESTSLKTYSINELCDLFINNKNYSHPENQKESFSNKVIKKLHYFATHYSLNNLIKAIAIIEKWKQYSNEFSESLRYIYGKNKVVVDFLYKILEAGMYMRGWKVIGGDKFPLTEDQTKLFNSDLQYEIEKQVHTSILDTQGWIDSDRLNEDERKTLKNLPLMKFSHEKDNKIFILTPDPDDGSSMMERLQIVLDGNKHKNMKSCIRLSSNILLHSVYFYICSLGLPEPYNIFELEHIT